MFKISFEIRERLCSMLLQVISNDICSFTPANDAHNGTGVDPSLGLVLISAHAGGGGGGGEHAKRLP